MDDSSVGPPKKKTRRPSSLDKFVNKLPPGQKYILNVDSKGKIIGPLKTAFKNFIEVVARSKISILPFSWEDVDERTKEMAWRDVKLTFEVPENEEFKKEWMSHMGGCWKQFKTRLNSEYVFGNGDADGNTTPCDKYSAISIDTWAAYFNSRTTPEFVAKREAAKNKQKKNVYPHTMGPGGYEKLKENLKEEEIKKRKEEGGDPNLQIEPTSPERHELWKAARKTNNHWQLVVLIPNANTVVWMCSYNRQPKSLVKQMFSNGLKGNSTSDATWLYPIMPIQSNGYHCGYYVMKFMLTLFTVGIVDNWDKVFEGARTYTEEQLLEVRELWAEFYLKIRSEQKDTLF